MGHTTATAKICNPQDNTKCIETELIVDTGSTYTWVRREKLETIGIRPSKTRKFRTIEGKTIERKVSEAVIECLRKSATRIVVFAEKGDAEVMGIDTLEGLGLEIDPVTKQLRKAESLLALTATTDQ
jgi:predicted aspartyl protease